MDELEKQLMKGLGYEVAEDEQEQDTGDALCAREREGEGDE